MLLPLQNSVNEKYERENSDSKLDYARFLLVRTSETVSEIAEKCGWASESSFTDYFRRQVGVTPAHYREWHQG
jgi:AraC-like DNA-binding protein